MTAAAAAPSSVLSWVVSTGMECSMAAASEDADEADGTVPSPAKSNGEDVFSNSD